MFYAASDYYYLPLLAGVIATHFYAGKFNPQYRRRVIQGVILMDVLVLAYFKFVQEDIHLPLGLSFYIFQCLSWLFDILNGRAKPDMSAVEFAGSVTYFPHLPAGPILRTNDLRSTFQAEITWVDCKAGILFFTLGLFKKTIADLLAPLTEANLFNGTQSSLEAWTGGIAGLARLYGDFSGYTDMAWGISLLLGFRLPVNFFRPFSSTSITNYYSERWHITLGRWIREYLFVPISLKLLRKGIPVEIGILISFLIMSLWHGSSTTFILWGFYIGMLIIIEDRMKFRTGSIGIIRTNILVMIGLIIFYSSNVGTALSTIQSLVSFQGNVSHNLLVELALTTSAFIILIGLSFIDHKSLPRILHSILFWPLVYAFALISFVLGTGSRSFIYFDF